MVYLGLHRGVFCAYCYIQVRVRDPRRGAMDAHHSDGGCWAARGRAAQEETAAGRASARSVDSGAYVKQAEHADGTGRLGGGGAGSGGSKVRLLRLGRAE